MMGLPGSRPRNLGIEIVEKEFYIKLRKGRWGTAMLALTKKTDYALIALSALARRPDGLSSAREIAERYSVPLALLTNVLKNLARAGIVISERGACGGYRLARDAASINLHELITAIEGPFQFVQCVSEEEEGAGCELESSCPIRTPAHRIRGRLKQLLEEVTLAELVGNDVPSRHRGEVPRSAPIPLTNVSAGRRF